jgi:hypothetical protein
MQMEFANWTDSTGQKLERLFDGISETQAAILACLRSPAERVFAKSTVDLQPESAIAMDERGLPAREGNRVPK